MGKGKGSPEGFIAPVTPGRMLIEIDGVPLAIAKEASSPWCPEITYYYEVRYSQGLC